VGVPKKNHRVFLGVHTRVSEPWFISCMCNVKPSNHAKYMTPSKDMFVSLHSVVNSECYLRMRRNLPNLANSGQKYRRSRIWTNSPKMGGC